MLLKSFVIILPVLLTFVATNSTSRAEPPPSSSQTKAKSPFELRDGDRVVLLGGTFIERMQSYGYLETLLTAAYPDRNITFRNLGWSGDMVWGDARAVFGSREDGFQRLVNDWVYAAIR